MNLLILLPYMTLFSVLDYGLLCCFLSHRVLQHRTSILPTAISLLIANNT